MKLSAVTVQKIKPASHRLEVPDALCTGLYLIVQTSGRKTWQVRYRHSGVHRRMKLGGYPILSLGEARERAKQVLAAVQLGRDPAEEVRAAKAPRPEEQRDRIAPLIELYAKRHLTNLKSGETVKRQLDRFVVKAWGEREIHAITKRDVIELLEGIADTGRGVTANRVRAYLNTFFNWAVQRDVILVSPALGVRPVSKEESRTRVLSDDEVRWFWQACEEIGYPWGCLGKLLLLTGQRLNEVAQITRDEISGDIWHLPEVRTKNGRAHRVPLAQPVQITLSEVPQLDGSGPFFLTTNGRTPVSGFNKGRRQLAEAMDRIAVAEHGAPVEIPHWTFHDLRRTAATGMARLEVPVRVTEAVLNHVSGTGGGIVAVYQLHDYAGEKRDALEAWSNFVSHLVAKSGVGEKSC